MLRTLEFQGPLFFCLSGWQRSIEIDPQLPTFQRL